MGVTQKINKKNDIEYYYLIEQNFNNGTPNNTITC